MIHPSTLAGPNWFTGSFGTNNPFQQNTSPFFRNTPFQGQQGGFGFGNNPFQNPSLGFGNNPAQFQNTINEIIRQTLPTAFTNFGFQPTNGFQTPSYGWNPNGFQTPTFGWNPNGFQTPTNTWTFGNQFQNTPFNNWQTQSFFTELIRQTTNQVLQSFQQLNQTSFSNPQQQQIWNTCVQICQQACYASCQPVCQAIVTCAVEAVNQQNPNNPKPGQQQGGGQKPGQQQQEPGRGGQQGGQGGQHQGGQQGGQHGGQGGQGGQHGGGHK